jgi:predicted dehydrogenase
MPPRWRVGLAGVGRGSGYGKLFADEPRCEVSAVCDISPQALERFARELNLPDSRCFLDYGDFVQSGLDIVFVGTPMPCHAEQSVAALEADCAVLSEVTAASDLAGCEQIVEGVRRTGGVYMLAENCIYWHFVSEWKQMVQAGKLGEIFYAEAEYLHPIPELLVNRATGEPKWRCTRAPLHYCTHSLGPILDITGDRVVRVSAIGQGHRIMPEAPIGGIDIQVALLETERGMIVKLLRSSVIPRSPAIHYYGLHGTKGYVETDHGGPVGPGRLYIKGEMDRDREVDVWLSDPTLPESARAGGHGTAEYSLVQDFLGSLERNETPRIDVVRAMDITVPGLIAHESATRGGEWLDVPRLA